MNATRPFPLADVLSVLTGRPVAPSLAEDAIRLMEWMTGRQLIIRDFIFFRRIPAASRTCRAVLRVYHADLAAVTVPDFTDEQAVAAWVIGMTARFGRTRDIARLGAVPEQRKCAA
jgi:hypothetical protein